MQILMKRFIPILLVLVALSCCRTLSARSYLGGSFSFAGNWNKDQGGNLVNSLSLSLSPEIGWFVGERWTVGFKPTVALSATSSNDSRIVLLGVSPYARYRFLELKKFGLWAEGNLNFRYSGSKNDSRVGNYSLIYGLDVRPLLTYDLTEHVILYCAVNLLSLSLHGSSTYYAESSNWFNSFSFGFSGKTDNVVDHLSTVSIGFLYRF